MSRKKVGSVTQKGEAEILRGGGAPEVEVERWWNALAPVDRASVALACGADYDTLGNWEDLIPMGQQMKIHMWYDDGN